MTLPIFKSLFTIYQIVFFNLPIVFRIGWLPVAILTIASTWISLIGFNMQEALNALPDDVTPEEMARAIAPIIGEALPLLLIAFLAMVVATSGFLKWVLRGEEPDWLNAAFGADELRLAGSWALSSLLMLGVYIGAISALSILLEITSQLLGANVQILSGLGAGGLLALMVYLGARLSLVAPVVIRDQRWGLAAAWAESKTNGWRLAAFWGLTIAPIYVATLAYTLAFVPDYFELASGSPDESAQLINRLRDLVMPMAIVSYILNIPTWALLGAAGGVALRLMTGGGIATGQGPASQTE